MFLFFASVKNGFSHTKFAKYSYPLWKPCKKRPSQITNVYHMVVQCSLMFANIKPSITVFNKHFFDVCEDSSKCEKRLCLAGGYPTPSKSTTPLTRNSEQSLMVQCAPTTTNDHHGCPMCPALTF